MDELDRCFGPTSGAARPLAACERTGRDGRVSSDDAQQSAPPLGAADESPNPRRGRGGSGSNRLSEEATRYSLEHSFGRRKFLRLLACCRRSTPLASAASERGWRSLAVPSRLDLVCATNSILYPTSSVVHSLQTSLHSAHRWRPRSSHGSRRRSPYPRRPPRSTRQRGSRSTPARCRSGGATQRSGSLSTSQCLAFRRSTESGVSSGDSRAVCGALEPLSAILEPLAVLSGPPLATLPFISDPLPTQTPLYSRVRLADGARPGRRRLHAAERGAKFRVASTRKAAEPTRPTRPPLTPDLPTRPSLQRGLCAAAHRRILQRNPMARTLQGGGRSLCDSDVEASIDQPAEPARPTRPPLTP